MFRLLKWTLAALKIVVGRGVLDNPWWSVRGWLYARIINGGV